MKGFYVFFKKIIFFFLSIFFLSVSKAQPPTISYLSEATGFTAPVNIANAGDGSNRLFIVQQDGVIMVRNGLSVTQFANFGSTGIGGANIILYGGERGLLGLAFHPQFNGTSNRYFFIYHNDLSGNIAITRCQTTMGNSNTADLSTITNIITIPHPTNSNHNGGQLRFGTDGYLYFATGDGGGGNDAPNNAQTGTVLLGKMLRIDIDHTSVTWGNYDVPADNPYVNDPGNLIDDRIFNLGLRNPYRWSFDRLNSDLWIGDVGQDAWEEIDYRPAANAGHNNFGWRCFEGYVSTPGVPDCTPTDYVPPVMSYSDGASSAAIDGGFVYRGTEFPTFYGRYIATDVYTGQIYMLWPNGSGGFDSTNQASGINFIVAFGEGEDGTLYAVSQGTNALYKVIATGGSVLPVTLKNFSGVTNEGYNDLHWQTAFEQNTARFYVEYSRDSYHFTRVGTVAATHNSSGSSYDFRHYTDTRPDLYYRLAIETDMGSVSYSSIIKLKGKRDNIRIYPTVINNNMLNIELNGKQLNRIKLYNATGALILEKDLSNLSDNVNIPLPALSKGVYIAELAGEGFVQTTRIFIQ